MAKATKSSMTNLSPKPQNPKTPKPPASKLQINGKS